jgi:hypothetical protein
MAIGRTSPVVVVADRARWSSSCLLRSSWTPAKRWPYSRSVTLGSEWPMRWATGQDVGAEVDEHRGVAVAEVVGACRGGEAGRHERGPDDRFPELIPIQWFAGPVEEQGLGGLDGGAAGGGASGEHFGELPGEPRWDRDGAVTGLGLGWPSYQFELVVGVGGDREERLGDGPPGAGRSRRSERVARTARRGASR